jgi:hypothetical protein
MQIKLFVLLLTALLCCRIEARQSKMTTKAEIVFEHVRMAEKAEAAHHAKRPSRHGARDNQSVPEASMSPAYERVRVTEGTWDTRFSKRGVSDAVLAIATMGGDLYVGGWLSEAGSEIVNCVARWDGNAWSDMGGGLRDAHGAYSSDHVAAMAVTGQDLYVGGMFRTAGGDSVRNVARWSGGEWFDVGGGVDGYVTSLAFLGTDLLVAGSFSHAGGVEVKGIAKWNGMEWSAVDVEARRINGERGYISDIAVVGDIVYFGGTFDSIGGITAKNLAQWDGHTCSEVGGGVRLSSGDGTVYSIVIADSLMYVGGRFDHAGDLGASGVACWNGSTWIAMGTGISGTVYALASTDSGLVAGGSFSNAAAPQATCLARWDGSAWTALGEFRQSWSPAVYALASNGGRIYAGGVFDQLDDTVASSIVVREGGRWHSVGGGEALLGEVACFTRYQNNLVAAGTIRIAGRHEVRNIALWDGYSWSPLGGGIDGYVVALAVLGDDLYAAGGFDSAGGVPARNITRWNGIEWSSVGEGVNSSVFDLETLGGSLYVTGSFDSAGGVPVRFLARWDGVSWSPLNTDEEFFPEITAVYGGGLYAYGYTNSSPWYRQLIARWTGAGWERTGYLLDGHVYTLEASEIGLVAGGHFESMQGFPAENIAIYDGVVWHDMGRPFEYTWGLVCTPDAVIASDGLAGLKRWDGVEWSGIQGEFSGQISEMEVLGADLYLGGPSMRAVSGIPSYGISCLTNGVPVGVAEHRTELIPAMYDLAQNFPNPFNSSTTITWEIPSKSVVKVRIFDALGRMVEELADGVAEPGRHTSRWENAAIASGVYFCRMEASSVAGPAVVHRMSRKMVLMR